jgi:hypothetical protein
MTELLLYVLPPRGPGISHFIKNGVITWQLLMGLSMTGRSDQPVPTPSWQKYW